MLTPAYYPAPDGDTFRNEINKFVHFARLVPFQHPLEDSVGQIPSYIIKRAFGDGIGLNGTAQHHPAIDLHVENGNTLVNMYAAHEGYVKTYRDAAKYRHYLSIEKNIEDSIGNVIGKMGHCMHTLNWIWTRLIIWFLTDNLCIKETLFQNICIQEHWAARIFILKIRYYRPADADDKAFYGRAGASPDFTEPSAGSWSYGYWHPDIGYGFANTENYLSDSASGIISNDFGQIRFIQIRQKTFLSLN